jgi:hypothetical protein
VTGTLCPCQRPQERHRALLNTIGTCYGRDKKKLAADVNIHPDIF